MTLALVNHPYAYESESLCRVFFPDEQIAVERDAEEGAGSEIVTLISGDGLTAQAVVRLFGDEKTAREDIPQGARDDVRELRVVTALYHALVAATGYTPPWGLLTGVRPSKLMNTLIGESGADAAEKYFSDTLLVSRDKTSLARRVADAQRGIISALPKDSFSLYVSVPFCPSRCSYCSFVSHSVTSPNARKLIEPYVVKLSEEIGILGGIAREVGLHLETVYFGGGTPTTLSAQQLDTLLRAVEDSFDMCRVAEYTVEAGRPDTVTTEKLGVLRAHSVNRVSINAQSFDDNVLAAIGRRHSAAQVFNAFEQARDAGFDNINTDLIAGLPADTPGGFVRSLDAALSLGPENISVHTLALKRSSELFRSGEEYATGEETSRMLADADMMLGGAGYFPYYMYRQSRSVGNLENVGRCLKGKEGLYNIYMMEECHTVLAAGAGAVTKLRRVNEGEIERIFNHKYPYEYISRFDELTTRKGRIKEFFNS